MKFRTKFRKHLNFFLSVCFLRTYCSIRFTKLLKQFQNKNEYYHCQDQYLFFVCSHIVSILIIGCYYVLISAEQIGVQPMSIYLLTRKINRATESTFCINDIDQWSKNWVIKSFNYLKLQSYSSLREQSHHCKSHQQGNSYRG